jgi:hypothetical protein
MATHHRSFSGKARHGEPLDELSDWELPPRSAGDARPVRVFDSAEHAIACLARLRDRAFRKGKNR